jgi:hypothetical protein
MSPLLKLHKDIPVRKKPATFSSWRVFGKSLSRRKGLESFQNAAQREKHPCDDVVVGCDEGRAEDTVLIKHSEDKEDQGDEEYDLFWG